MLCPSCRRQVTRGAGVCQTCGRAVGPGDEPPLELVLAGGARVTLVDEILIGRAPGCTVQLEDPSVSRTHARISVGLEGGALIEDAGSSHGTWVDGVRVTDPVPLRDGALIALGDQRLHVERRRAETEAGRTIVVRAGASLVLKAAAAGAADGATSLATADAGTVVPEGADGALRPRVRSGYALKRLDASEGAHRWVLQDLERDSFVRLSDVDAELLRLLDGSRTLRELLAASETRVGGSGPARIARLIADLGERGLLAGATGPLPAAGGAAAPPSGWRRWVRSREKLVPGVGPFFERLYRGGGWLLFTRPALALFGLVAVVGIGVFVALVAGRYGTPFVVASKIGWGGLVFLGGRLAMAAVHETAHGLAMASFGRRVRRAGFKLLLIFPYAFVDTSEAWFEPRRRRIAVSAAGPVSDLTLAGVFSIACLLLAAGTIRDIAFQLAFGAYIAALFNLNPFLERDGYHMLVDWLREPGLRRRARAQFAARLAGRATPEAGSTLLARYSAWGLAWSVAAAAFAVVFSLRYEAALSTLVASWIVHVVMVCVWLACLAPVLFVVGPPLRERIRGPRPRAAG